MSTNTTNITAETIESMVRRLDDVFDTITCDVCFYEDLPGIYPVYRIGDAGYVSEERWDAVFALLPYDWAPAVYVMCGNDPDFKTVYERAAQLVNEGGREAVEKWNSKLDENGEADDVYYTELGQDC